MKKENSTAFTLRKNNKPLYFLAIKTNSCKFGNSQKEQIINQK
ncbi:hypothetical protein RA0C_0862 [Riemerella anatipestifer ATCC 11845 = DSM 15868]|uniref:Uncharacterized protein n=1 Tax=Riemerella anatipestifer (strain ATCC 11845 / DSM 15868 / JCM 9532 / NCTC 11014) TaxID=693978 RepID=H8M9K9_RIEAD|nr:hypothetical protein RA0C_0862 [Riemerella anatipestifer ATCC 11845 = DSM 15868]